MANHKVYLFDPGERGGVALNFNWIGANKSGPVVAGKADKSPGRQARVFKDIPDDKFETEPIYYRHDEHDSRGRETNATTDPDQLFKDQSFTSRGWIHEWHGFHDNSKWWQFSGSHVYNTSRVLYPFPVQGIAFTLAVPTYKKDYNPNKVRTTTSNCKSECWGDNTQINMMHGLWTDTKGKYYAYKMYPFGDNRGLGSFKGTGKHKGIHGGSDMEGNDGFYQKGITFLDHEDNMKGTHSWMTKDNPDEAESTGLYVTTREDVTDLFFCGFSIQLHHNHKAASKRCHTIQVSQVTPIPANYNRYTEDLVVLGTPCEIELDSDGGYGRAILFDTGQQIDDNDELVPPDTITIIDTITLYDTIAVIDTINGETVAAIETIEYQDTIIRYETIEGTDD